MIRIIVLLIVLVSERSANLPVRPFAVLPAPLPFAERIVGGEETNIKDVPYQVAFLYLGEITCGGSIVKPKAIVTAAHCTRDFISLPASWFSIRAGSSKHNFGGQVIQCSHTYRHDELAAPIALASQGAVVPDGTPAVTSGWGQLSFPCPTTMTLLQYLSNEEALQPWIVAERGFKQLFVLMEGSEEYSRLQKMVLQLNDKRLRNLGTVNLKNEEPIIRQNRENSISVACSAGSQDCALRGLMQVPSKSLGRSQRGSVRGVELCAALRALPESEVYVNWNLLWREFTSSQLTAVSKEIMEALPCVSDEVTLKLFIQRVLGSELDGSQVTALLRGLISSSPRGAGVILDILKEKHILNTLKQKMVGRNNRDLSDILRTLGEHITTQESYDVLDELAAQWRQDGVSVVESEALVEAQEAARINISWIRDQRPEVEQWLRNNIH